MTYSLDRKIWLVSFEWREPSLIQESIEACTSLRASELESVILKSAMYHRPLGSMVTSSYAVPRSDQMNIILC